MLSGRETKKTKIKMDNYQFGKRSIEKLSTCHPDLQKVARMALRYSQVDFGIADGQRPVSEQQRLFAEGKTQLDGVRRKSMHNFSPSLAFDIYAFVQGRPDLAYDTAYLCYLGGVITSVGQQLFSKGEISRPIIWGYNWDGDGQIRTDQNFQDLPHFQLGPTIHEQ